MEGKGFQRRQEIKIGKNGSDFEDQVRASVSVCAFYLACCSVFWKRSDHPSLSHENRKWKYWIWGPSVWSSLLDLTQFL